MTNRVGRFEAVSDFLRRRFPLEKLNFQSMVHKKEVPVHKMSWAYYMGGLALFFFAVQLVTGLMLLFYYEPTVSDAHASVEYINEHVPGGALVRNIHAWGSSCMIFCVVVHMITAFAMKAFEKPREITWVTGVALFFLVFAFGFTGYLLPWNQIAVNATKVGLQSVEEVGRYLPGEMATWPVEVREIIQGESAVGQATLSRFYAIHVVVLPLALISVLALHLLSVQIHGMSQGVDRPTGKTEKFLPFFILKDFSVWGAAFLVFFVVALCLPFEAFFSYPLFEAYDSLGSTPDGIKPEWYFFFIYYPLELLPFWVVMLASMAGKVVLFLAPWIFKGASRTTLRVLAAGVVVYLVVSTIFGQAIYELLKGAH